MNKRSYTSNEILIKIWGAINSFGITELALCGGTVRTPKQYENAEIVLRISAVKPCMNRNRLQEFENEVNKHFERTVRVCWTFDIRDLERFGEVEIYLFSFSDGKQGIRAKEYEALLGRVQAIAAYHDCETLLLINEHLQKMINGKMKGWYKKAPFYDTDLMALRLSRVSQLLDNLSFRFWGLQFNDNTVRSFQQNINSFISMHQGTYDKDQIIQLVEIDAREVRQITLKSFEILEVSCYGGEFTPMKCDKNRI